MKTTFECSTNICSFTGFETHAVRYGFFDRHNGVSKEPFSSRNIGLTVGDKPESVIKNRELIRDALGVRYLLTGRQTHGERVFVLEDSLTDNLEVDDFDALITQQRNVGLAIQHADCQAILLYDPENAAVGAVHSGWRGSVINVLEKTVSAMNRAFNTNPSSLQAVISPSLGPCCAEFVSYASELPHAFTEFMVEGRDNMFDFWQISKKQLTDCGLKESAIRLPTICTSCSDDYFSYRRACRTGTGVTGRNCSVIAILEK